MSQEPGARHRSLRGGPLPSGAGFLGECVEEGVRDAAAFAVNLIDYWRSLLVSVNDHQFAALGFHYGGCANLPARAALSGEGKIGMMVFVIQLHAALLLDSGGLRCCQVFVLFGD